MHARRMLALATLALVAAITWAAPSSADPFKPGTIEFSPSLAFSRSSFSNSDGISGSTTHVDLSASGGRFLTEYWEMTGSVLLQRRTGRNAIGAGVGATYNYPQQSGVMPFLGGSVGIISYLGHGSTDYAVLLPVIKAGVRSMISDGRSVNLTVGYQHEVNPKSTFEKSSDVFNVGVGMSLFSAR